MSSSSRPRSWYARNRTVRRWFRTWWSFFVILPALGIALATVSNPNGPNPPIRSDGRGYHIWTRAILDRDLSFRKYERVEGVHVADPVHHVFRNKFPPGVALLRFPIMAWLVDRRPGAPLISPAEHWANQILGALALCVVCVFTLSACRLLNVPSGMRNFALIALVFGTGLFHYATYDASFSHVYSAMCVSILLWLGVRSIASEHPGVPAFPATLVGFFLVLIRNTNVMVLSALFLAYVYWRKALGALSWKELRKDSASLGGGAAAGLILQLGYNWITARSPTLSSYGGEEFRWARPMQASVLLSYERGLFTYYPVLGVVLIAAFSARRSRVAAAWYGLLLLAYVCLYGFWHSWMLGCGFGHRGFVELAPIGAVLFGVAVASIPSRWRAVAVASAVVCVMLTLRLMIGYWEIVIPMCGVKSEQFWSLLVGKDALPRFLRF